MSSIALLHCSIPHCSHSLFNTIHQLRTLPTVLINSSERIDSRERLSKQKECWMCDCGERTRPRRATTRGELRNPTVASRRCGRAWQPLYFRFASLAAISSAMDMGPLGLGGSAAAPPAPAPAAPPWGLTMSFRSTGRATLRRLVPLWMEARRAPRPPPEAGGAAAREGAKLIGGGGAAEEKRANNTVRVSH